MTTQEEQREYCETCSDFKKGVDSGESGMGICNYKQQGAITWQQWCILKTMGCASNSNVRSLATTKYDPRLDLNNPLTNLMWVNESAKHDDSIRNAMQKFIIDLIKQTDDGACPYRTCIAETGSVGNCRECLIHWVEESLRLQSGVVRR